MYLNKTRNLALLFSVCILASSMSPARAEVAVKAQKNAGGDTFLVQDFENGDLKNNLGGDSGAWNLDPDDKNAFCDVKIADRKDASGTGKCLKIIYNVDSNKPAQCGYWTKLKLFDAMPYDHIEFDIKGDAEAGFSNIVRVELKKYKDLATRINKLTGMYTIKNVTGEWQTVKIPLTYFNGLYDKTQEEVWKNPRIVWKDLDEFVIVLHRREVNKKKGAIYIDNIRFVKTGEKSPSVFDRPASASKDKEYILLDDPSYAREFLAPNGKDNYEKKPVDFPDVEKIREQIQNIE